ncbi:MAG TPA: hypothetical protein VFJ76_07640 [Solirubrobacterales bacterium]|nr:hypothetical protein [Solirubrobacterales bacterium]
MTSLSPQEKQAILAGKHPALVRSVKGEEGEIVLRSTRTPLGPVPQVSVTITGWRKLKKGGGYKAIYSVEDNRELYLNRGLGYTRSKSRALDTEAPVLDEETAQKFAMEGEQKTALQSGERTAEQKKQGKEQRKGSSRRSERAIQRHAKRLGA